MRQARLRRSLAFLDNGRIGRQPFAAGKINCQTDQHADACRAETPMPAVNFAECAGDQRRGNYSTVDEYVIDLESVRAPVVASRVERADLAGEVSFKTTDACEQAHEREKKRHIERHKKVSGGHEQCAERDGACAPDYTVG